MVLVFGKGRRSKEILQNQAVKYNGTVSSQFGGDTLLEFSYKNYPIKIIVRGYGGRYNSFFTQAETRIDNPKGLSFSLHVRTAFSKLGKNIGGKDILIGNSNFDDQFVIKGNNDELIPHLFPLPVQEKLLQLKKIDKTYAYSPTLILNSHDMFIPKVDNQLLLRVIKILKTEEEYNLLIDSFLLLIDCLYGQ
jgi:hypothetical protein